MEKKYLTVIEVGEIYGIKRNALYKLIKEGKLHKHKLNGTKLSVKELDSFAEEQKVVEVKGE